MIKFTEQLEQEEIDDELDDEIVNFLLDLDIELLDEEMQERLNYILEELFGEEDEIGEDPEIMESVEGVEDLIEFTRLKAKRVSPAVKAKRKRLYRKNKAKIKIASAKRRKTAGFKRTAVKAKRMAKQGKTSTGKRMTRRA